MRICRKFSSELAELYESMLSPEERRRLPPVFSHPYMLFPFSGGDIMPARQQNSWGYITYTIRGELLNFLRAKNKKVRIIAGFNV